MDGIPDHSYSGLALAGSYQCSPFNPVSHFHLGKCPYLNLYTQVNVTPDIVDPIMSCLTVLAFETAVHSFRKHFNDCFSPHALGV